MHTNAYVYAAPKTGKAAQRREQFVSRTYRAAHPVVRVPPETGDLVLFGNRSTQHYAPDGYGDLPRLLHRVTAAGAPRWASMAPPGTRGS